MRHKFHNHTFTRDGIKWASRLEYTRWLMLREAEKDGVITDLRRQVTYLLIPRQTETVTVQLKTRTKQVEKFREHPCTYTADFVYLKDGVEIIEDTKGEVTQQYVIRRKLMRWYGRPIREVKKASEAI